MSKLKIHKMIVGPVQTNCYLVYNEESKETLIIDPGDQADRIREQIRIHQLCPCAILLTHGHFDHIMAAEELRREYDLPVYAGEEERTLTGDPSMNASREFGVSCAVTIDRGLSDGQQLSLAGFSIRVIHTPGHTRGGVCYYFDAERVLFSGDTLFAASVGRTDLPTGSMSQIIRSIREKLFHLPDDTRVLPGHGEDTMIGYEKKHNPFLF